MKIILKIILLLLFFTLLLSPVIAQEGPIVTASITQGNLLPGVPFAVTIIIDYPAPEEINVIAPPYNTFLSLDRLRKYPRTTESGVQTVVEYRFIANNSGRFVLESFTVVSPAGVTETNSFILNVRSENEMQRIITPRLTWEGIRQITAGERLTLTLRAADWNSPNPPPAFFTPEVPQGVILFPQSVTPEERTNGILLKLTLIPLTAGNFHLPARTLTDGNIRFEIPRLNLSIN